MRRREASMVARRERDRDDVGVTADLVERVEPTERAVEPAFTIDTSYRQLIASDHAEELASNRWTPAHSRQGVARRPRAANIGTLQEFGDAPMFVELGPDDPP
jgi:hypothetical protein